MKFTLWATLFLTASACGESNSTASGRNHGDRGATASQVGSPDGSAPTQPPRSIATDANAASESSSGHCPDSTTTPFVVAAASDAGVLNDLFVDSNGAYFAEGSLLFSSSSNPPVQYSTGTVRVAPLGGGEATVLWSGEEFAQSVVASDTFVYFAVADRGTATRDAEIYQLALKGGSPTQLASWTADGTATALAYSAGQVCWSYTSGTGGSVFCTAGDSHSATSASAFPSSGVLALNQSEVFWPSAAAVWGMDRSAPTQLAQVVWNATSALHSLASAPGGHVLVASDDSTIYRVSPGTMSASALLRPTSTPASLVTDGAFVYWTEPASGTIEATSINGGTEALLVSGQKYPTKITIWNGMLYWVDILSKEVLRTSACSQ